MNNFEKILTIAEQYYYIIEYNFSTLDKEIITSFEFILLYLHICFMYKCISLGIQKRQCSMKNTCVYFIKLPSTNISLYIILANIAYKINNNIITVYTHCTWVKMPKVT